MSEHVMEHLVDLYGDYTFAPWDLSGEGVSKKKIVKSKGSESVEIIYASPIPLVPSAILRNIDSSVEKIELEFYKFGEWRKIITERSVAANKNAITRLADKGIEVNTGSAAQLVQYIADVVAQNESVISCRPAKSVMGWTDFNGERSFMPYTDSIVFDGDDQYKFLYESICQKGSLQEWVDYMKPLREKPEVRLFMAAAFASPLIEIVNANPFVFHLWGQSGCGKTVALMIAMSIFGDPSNGKMTRTMNMTTNSMLSTAAFLKNLPFGGDELQTIKSRWSNYDNLIMCITEGVDRGRMSYDKINEIKSWKCSFLFTGEEPCTKSNSGAGAKNRVIEIQSPDLLIENGNAVVNFLRNHYGSAGSVYIDSLEDKDVRDLYDTYFSMILVETNATDKQASSMALMLTADTLAGKLFWPEEKDLPMELIKSLMPDASDIDVAERAYQFICDTVAENANNFSWEARTVWGRTEEDSVIINKTVLCRLLSQEGFDFDAVKRKWFEKGYIVKNAQGKFRHTLRMNNTYTGGVKLMLPKEDAS